MIGLGLYLTTGREGLVPIVASAATAVLVGLAIFATNVLVSVKSAP